MFKINSTRFNWCGKIINIETGKVARHADSSIMLRSDSTVMMVNITVGDDLKSGVEFLPLTVNYIEKYYSVGKYPGGFIKRESRPSEREVLISRLIDRPIRPLFPKDFFYEVNITCTLLSYDKSICVDILAFLGVSVALNISSLPFNHTLALCRVITNNGQCRVNLEPDYHNSSTLDLALVGSKDSIMMIESSSKEISNTLLIEAVDIALKSISVIEEQIKKFILQVSATKMEYRKINYEYSIKNLQKHKVDIELTSLLMIKDSKQRKHAIKLLYKKYFNLLGQDDDFEENIFGMAFKELERSILRNFITNNTSRIDGRQYNEIRPISSEIDFLPMAHGSSLFTRGETQSLSTVTLGSVQDSQIIDTPIEYSQERFILHYNFPSYSVGECGPIKAPGRRDIGHGKLAQKALLPVMPSLDDYPYTVRVVSEITESNGSSSMATVCAASMALMQAGVPISRAVSGIAMGLVMFDKKKYIVLSDISGEEDYLGDMDLKVASTDIGITALQMDIKIPGITKDILVDALVQAREGCTFIRNIMNNSISIPSSMNLNAPRVHSFKINKNKIKDLIGPGGKMIKDICDRTGAKIDIEDNGKVTLFCSDNASLEASLKIVHNITDDVKIGHKYVGNIISIKPFGIFIKFNETKEGLAHISEIVNRRIDNIENVFNEGDKVNVKVVSIEKGKIKLTMKNIAQDGSFCQNITWKKWNS